MEKRQVLGVLSSLVLLGGVFAPALTIGLPVKITWFSFPLSGNVSYFQYTAILGNNEWLVLVGLAVVGLVLVLLRMCIGLLFTSVMSGGMVVFTVIDVQYKAAFILSPLSDSTAAWITQWTNVLSAFLIQFSWGSMLLVAGPVLMFVAGLMPGERRAQYHSGKRFNQTIVCSRCRALNHLSNNFCAQCAVSLRPAKGIPAVSYQSTSGNQASFLPQASHRPPPHG